MTLLEYIAELEAQIAELQAEIDALRRIVAELEAPIRRAVRQENEIQRGETG